MDSNLTLSDNGLLFIKQREACRLKSYQDIAGVWTCGYGTIRYSNGKKVGPNETITQSEAESLLRMEVKDKIAEILPKVAGIKLTQNQKDAIISFTYNVGTAGFLSSSLLKKLKVNPNDPSIETAFKVWNKIHDHGVLKVSNGLSNRRAQEWQLYNTK